MELMIAELLAAAPSRGVSRVSLNFAVFRSSLARGERIGAGPLLRAWVGLLLVASRWWQIASLYRANAKFRPAWEPRFICFRLARDLGPIIGAALAVEGFLHWPRIPRHRTNSTLRRLVMLSLTGNPLLVAAISLAVAAPLLLAWWWRRTNQIRLVVGAFARWRRFSPARCWPSPRSFCG